MVQFSFFAMTCDTTILLSPSPHLHLSFTPLSFAIVLLNADTFCTNKAFSVVMQYGCCNGGDTSMQRWLV